MTLFARHVLNRLSFGPSNASMNEFINGGSNDAQRLTNWVNAQLNWQTINDTAFQTLLNQHSYQTLNWSLSTAWYNLRTNRADGVDHRMANREAVRIKLARAVHSKRQLLEVLADFWHDHFSLNGWDGYAIYTLVSWDRDVIRPDTNPARSGHLFGNFRQMLELSSKHPAMLYYLDNYINRDDSPNENYAREIIELHTLGAMHYVSLGDPASIPRIQAPMPWGPNGADIPISITEKYVDDDIYAAMRILTGWTVKDNANQESSNFQNNGEWFFYENWHDKFEKTILGHSWPYFASTPEDVYQFLDLIAYHPATALHIASKLCRRFVSESAADLGGILPRTLLQPAGNNEPLVLRVARTFYDNRYASDQLTRTYRTLFLSPEFQDMSHAGSKLKRPFELVASTLRAIETGFFPQYVPGSVYDEAYRITEDYLYYAGNRPYNWAAPDGYPDRNDYWENPVTFIKAWRTIDWMCDHYENLTDANGNSYREYEVLPVVETTLQNLPPADHTPSKITAFWLKRLLQYEPAGGWNGHPLHNKLLWFMTHRPDSDVDPSVWPADFPIPDISSDSSPHFWHERIRGLVKLIVASPEFMVR